jgi:hypothetical protein
MSSASDFFLPYVVRPRAGPNVPSDQGPIALPVALPEHGGRHMEVIMKRPMWRYAGLVLAAALPVTGAHAQLDSLLKKGAHGSELSGLKGMAGMAGSPLTSGSMSNVAGLLHYCIYNNYLGGTEATSVKDRLTSKLPTGGAGSEGGEGGDDRGYSDGQKGLLHGSNGNLLDLHGGGLTPDVTRKACETILAQGKSFL